MTDHGSEDGKTHLAFDNRTTARGPFLKPLTVIMQLQPALLTPCAVIAVDVHAAQRPREVPGLLATHDVVRATDCGATRTACDAPWTVAIHAMQLLSPPPDAML